MYDCLVASFHRYAAKILGRKDKPFSTKDFCCAPVAQYRPIGARLRGGGSLAVGAAARNGETFCAFLGWRVRVCWAVIA